MFALLTELMVSGSFHFLLLLFSKTTCRFANVVWLNAKLLNWKLLFNSLSAEEWVSSIFFRVAVQVNDTIIIIAIIDIVLHCSRARACSPATMPYTGWSLQLLLLRNWKFIDYISLFFTFLLACALFFDLCNSHSPQQTDIAPWLIIWTMWASAVECNNHINRLVASRHNERKVQTGCASIDWLTITKTLLTLLEFFLCCFLFWQKLIVRCTCYQIIFRLSQSCNKTRFGICWASICIDWVHYKASIAR